MRRTARLLLLTVALGSAAPRASAQEPGSEPLIGEARPLVVALEPSEEMRVFVYRSRPGARAIHFVSSAGQDLDLAVADRRLAVSEASSAEHVGYTVRTIENVVVRPREGESFPEERTWYIHLFRAWNYESRAPAELHAWEEHPDTTRIPEGVSVVDLDDGSGKAVREFFVPMWAAQVHVRAESSLGDLELRVGNGRRNFEGRPAGKARALRFDRDPIDPAGVWKLELTDPRGRAARVAVEVAWTVRASELAFAIGGEEYRLEGAEGERTIDLDPDEEAYYFLDVDDSVTSLEVDAEMGDGAFGIALARRMPPAYPDRHLHDLATGDEPRKRVGLGGAAPLPAGRYWIRVDHGGEGAASLRLVWSTRATTASVDEGAVSPLTPGRPESVTFDPGNARVRFGLPPRLPAGTHLQLIGSGTDADLFVRRADTGEIVQGGASDRADEYLVLSELAALAGDGLLLDVVRWQTGHRETAGTLHVDTARRPTPPREYFPPYTCWKRDDPWQRALASTVELISGDGGGSGTVVTPTGLILTAAHVLEGRGEILVSFPCTREGVVRQCLVAEVVERTGEDLDLALLRVTGDTFAQPLDPARRLTFAPLLHGEPPLLGDPLRLLGYPAATEGPAGGNLTVLQGIVSALQREGEDLVWLVSDAPVSSGNSGGGMFDAQHRLLGVLLSVDTLAFARPVERMPAAWLERIRAEGGEVR